jgi:hypothetical protein
MSRYAVVFWILFLLTISVYLTMILWSLPHLRDLAGGLTAFDLRPTGYSPAEARALVSALGTSGADFYLNVQLWLDTAYPALLAAVLVLAFNKLAQGWLVWLLCCGAVFMALSDYLENRVVAAMLRAGSVALTDDMVASASNWTLLKSASSTPVFIMLVILLMHACWRWLRYPKNQ